MIRKVQVIVYLRKPRALILLLRRPPGWSYAWQPVTGHIEPEDEDFLEAGRREVLEETGIQEIARVVDPKIEFRFDRNGWVVVEHLVGIELESQPLIKLSNEHVSHAWMEPSEALELLHWETNKDGLKKVLTFAGVEW